MSSEEKCCNQCGKKMDEFDIQQGFAIHRKIKYGSVHDGSCVHYTICCECFDEMVSKCAISPIAEAPGEDGEYSEEDSWKWEDDGNSWPLECKPALEASFSACGYDDF